MMDDSEQVSSTHRLRIFLASPGDVVDERALALRVVEQLEYDPLLRGRITLEAVAWDKPGGGTPMLATMTPQEAIDRGLPKPSQCDIVVVIIWSRMGTPLPDSYTKPDGGRYASGTEWEFEDAVRAATESGRPRVLVYRRSEKVLLDPADPDFEQKHQQWKEVKRFFASFNAMDGSILRGHNLYAAPEAFRSDLELHLKRLIRDLLDSSESSPVEHSSRPAAKSFLPLWKGSPFPGLRAFTAADAPIFFGRGRETDGLVRKLSDRSNRFIAVVGASGSGKSSLVAAGLLPRLHAGAIEGSGDWVLLRFTPGELGDDPFAIMAARLAPHIEGSGMLTREVASRLREKPEALVELAEVALASQPNWAELVLYVDQFEEALTLTDPRRREPFINALAAAAHSERIRVVVTLRADFYARCLELPSLAELLRLGSYPLSVPGPAALLEMITRPAERAGLMFEDGLVDRILNDTGAEPGALTLMAFALSELYEERDENGRLAHRDYESFNGVQGAIARRAEDTFAALDPAVQAALGEVFQEMVEVDERGVVTRQRAPLRRIVDSAFAGQLVDALAGARLLVESSNERGEPVVEVAHEALLSEWPRLEEWISTTREDLHLLRQIRLAAGEWERRARAEEYLWADKRLAAVYGMIDRLHPELNEVERRFVRPFERTDMLDELNDPAVTHQRRASVGQRLAAIGDTRYGIGVDQQGLPDLVWCDVAAGEIILEGITGTFAAPRFQIARYPITWAQYRAFLDAPNGFRDSTWWNGLSHRDEQPGEQYRKLDNHPAECVSWYDAVAFCRWLSARFGFEVRLPTEWEWQLAATGGKLDNRYPWGPEWDSRRANTDESGLASTTAVGVYPAGASPVGALDMCGNVWEWCLNEYDSPAVTALEGERPRTVRGGSWSWDHEYARATCRDRDVPTFRHRDHGLRVVRAVM